ncbi:unnamed protein product [Toxocara canis]|uniref:Secreted protein n=1 Tax=Toxocara canis TaxID=6265 RepID=A0A183UYC5_TOXCA|nr:unnamed protein product [Toxocara canis]
MFLFLFLVESLSGRIYSSPPENCEIHTNELAKIAASLLPPLTSALSEKLEAVVQPVVDRLDKLVELISKNQSPTT